VRPFNVSGAQQRNKGDASFCWRAKDEARGQPKKPKKESDVLLQYEPLKSKGRSLGGAPTLPGAVGACIATKRKNIYLLCILFSSLVSPPDFILQLGSTLFLCFGSEICFYMEKIQVVYRKRRGE